MQIELDREELVTILVSLHSETDKWFAYRDSDAKLGNLKLAGLDQAQALRYLALYQKLEVALYECCPSDLEIV
jgi:hypothetical protein